MKTSLIAVLAVLAAGCASGTLFSSRDSSASQHYYAIENSCFAQTLKYHCVDARVRNDDEIMDDPDVDLLMLALAYAKAVEDRVAAGTMTRDSGNIAIATLRSRTIQMGAQRVRNREFAAQQSFATALAGLAVYSMASRPYTLQQPAPSGGMIACWQSGQWVVCQ